MDEGLDYPISRYLGEYITCFPGSNQTDDGKLNLEYNAARFVTRVSSKNFCIVQPSFELSIYVEVETGLPQIRVTAGQASINGMDLIMTSEIYIDPPSKEGHYYLAFKLARDSSDNVLGDLVYGVTTTFQGVYLTYYTEKPDPMDPDMLYLGELDWDGNNFSNLVEDEDKYGRIWAEDILCKFEDPKHPDVRRLTLQEYIYNIPDWYFSKEGDIIYGPVTIANNRDDDEPGIILNVDETGSHITVKDPDEDNEYLQFYGDLNRDGVIDEQDLKIVQDIIDGTILPTDLQNHLGDVNHDGVIDEKDYTYIENFVNQNGENYGDTGNIYFIDNTANQINVTVNNGQYTVEIGAATIKESNEDDILHIHNEGDICVDAEGTLQLEADDMLDLHTEDENSLHLKVEENGVTVDRPSSDLIYNITYVDDDIMQQQVGKALWQYNNTTKKISLLQSDVSYLDIQPNADFNQSVRVQSTIYIGSESVYGNEKTYLKKLNWRLSTDAGKDYIDMTPKIINMISSDTTETSYLKIGNSTSTIYSKLNDDGSLELTNNTSTTPSIKFSDGTAAYNVTLYKIKGQKKLNIDGSVNITGDTYVEGSVTGKGGLITENGKLTFVNGTNNATITKDSNSSNLRTSNDLYVGSSGQGQLFAGNTVINGTFGVGGDSYSNCEFQVDASGNVNTSGTITGSKVYNAVYNDAVEFMEKADYNEIIEPGDVVCFTTNGKVKKVETELDAYRLAGVVSSEETYGYALGGEGLKDNQKVPIALIGRVYLKTDISVQCGDLLKVNSNGNIVKTDYIDRYTLGKATTNSKDGKVFIKII